MPTTPSRNSVGPNGRVTAAKPHIPFRGNDLEHGKKTGKTVPKVSRDADDFEPFEQVIGQAYQGDNPLRAANKKSRPVRNPSPAHDEEYDNSGEISMDIDSTQNSPSAYFNAASAPAPSSSKRSGSSSRPVATSSTADYDRIPSPKPMPKRTSVKPASGSKPKTPSGLRSEIQFEDDVEIGRDAPDHGMDDSFAGDTTHGNGDFGGDQSFDNDHPSMSHSNLSFTALAQDDDANMSEEEEPQSSPPAKNAKGKQRAVQQESEDNEENGNMEDDIATGMDAIDQQDDDEEEESLPKPVKKGRKAPPSNAEPPKKRARNAASKRQRNVPRVSTYENIDEDGLRRSKRQHYPPLEYWRQEKVVYGRRENGRSVVPVIKEIIRIPKPEPEPLGVAKRKRRGGTRPRSKSRTVGSPEVQEEIHIVEVENPEFGWDEDTQPNGIIMDFQSQTEVERRVVFPARLINPKPAQGEKFSYHKVFGDGNFVAAGQLIIPPGAEKPTKPTKDNTYIFHIIEGAVECKIHRTSFILSAGGQFMVPRGNQYYIKNICERDVKLFFTQARKVVADELDKQTPIRAPRNSVAPRGKTASRSSPKPVVSAQDNSSRG